MKKHIALSLLILSSAFAPAMEERAYQLIYESFSSFFFLNSYFPAEPSAGQMPNEDSELISNIRTNKNNLENQLLNNEWEQEEVTYLSALYLSGSFWINDIDTAPIKFFQACYYQKFHQIHIFNMLIHKLDTCAPLLKKCQNVQIDGYSALGAAMLAEDISDDAKRNFIQELINLDFKPTPKDIGLAELVLYDEIPAKQKEKIVFLLCSLQQSVQNGIVLIDNQKDNSSQLLPEIRTRIAQYMIQLFKKEFWFLPDAKQSLPMLDGYPL